MSEAGVTVATHYSIRQPASFAQFENSAKLFGVNLCSRAVNSEAWLNQELGLGAPHETRGLTAHGSPKTFHRMTAPHAFC